LDHYVDTQERENRFVGYYSPKFSGLQFQIATMPGKGDEAELGDAVSTALVYGDPKMKKSNYYLGIAYDDEVDGAETQAFRLAGSVKLGDLGLGAIVENADDGSDDHMRYIASGFYKIGDGKLELQYANADELGEHGESDQATIGWEHKLGGGASAYIAYSKRELEDVASDHASVGFIYKF
ncbi:MAG: porin, partial [Pseudomonadota bacterium]|nr:porin [Pseudomonadota bacterium]